MDKIICLVGESGSGKSTIAELLEKDGYNYKTDNYICDNCKKQFYGKRNLNSVKHFCSNKCHLEYMHRKKDDIKIEFINNTTVKLYVKNKIILVDYEDYKKIKEYNWYINKHGYAFAWNKNSIKARDILQK